VRLWNGRFLHLLLLEADGFGYKHYEVLVRMRGRGVWWT
jgi:hypothetical protein